LIGCLASQQVKAVPKYTSTVVQRHLKGACPQYQEFINAYSTNSANEVHKVAEQHADAFHKDHNFGLIKQCIQQLYHSNIKRQTQTYLTLGLSQIAESVQLNGPKEAERAVLRMIEEGAIFATINQKDGMVLFKENPEAYDDNRMLEKLDAQIKRTIDLANKLRTIDQEIASSPQYIQKTTMHERHGRWDFEDEMGGGPPGFHRGGPAGRQGKGFKKGLKLMS